MPPKIAKIEKKTANKKAIDLAYYQALGEKLNKLSLMALNATGTNPELAYQCYEKIIALIKNEGENRKYISNKIELIYACHFLNMGTVSLTLQNVNQAKIHFEQCLEIDPTNQVAQKNLAEIFCAQKEFDQALIKYKLLTKSSDIVTYTEGLYYIGLIHTEDDFKTKKTSVAVNAFEKIIALYQKNPKAFVDKEMRTKLIGSILLIAKAYDEGHHDTTIDDQTILTYYAMGAELNDPQCLHNLGYKYEHGEDVDVDLDMAVHYYARAAKLNFPLSILNLGRLQAHFSKDEKTQEEGLESLKLAAKNPTTMVLGIHCLGGYYLKAFHTSGNTNPKLAEKAFDYFRESAKLGNYNSLHDIANMYYCGFAVERNEELAIQYYQQAADANITESYKALINIYIFKLQIEKDKDRSDQYMKILSDLFAKSNLYPEIKNLTSRSTILVEFGTTQGPSRIATLASRSGYIIETAKDNKLGILKRLRFILETHVNSTKAEDVCAAIHRIGILTKRSLDERDFHQENANKYILLICQATICLDEKRLNALQVTQITESISKLQLKANVPLYKKAIEMIYSHVLTNIDSFNLQQLVSIIYAASNLDPTLPLFNNILPSIIEKVLPRANELPIKSLANLLYGLTKLNPVINTAVYASGFTQLMNCAIKMITSNTPANESMTEEKSSSPFSKNKFHHEFHQFYLSLYYFSKKYPLEEKVISDFDLLTCLTKLKPPSKYNKVSSLQNEIIELIALYCIKYSVEKDVNTLPVDAYLILPGNKPCILQVEGPSHFLHSDDGMPLANFKTQFHNDYLTLSADCPVISIPYYTWQDKKTPGKQFEYLAKLIFDATGVELKTNESIIKQLPNEKQIAKQVLFQPKNNTDNSQKTMPASTHKTITNS